MKETIIELVNKVLRNLPWGEISSHTASDVANYLIENDVVLVVRCKDCIHCSRDENIIGAYGYCYHFGCYAHDPMVEANDFCSYGERKDK